MSGHEDFDGQRTKPPESTPAQHRFGVRSGSSRLRGDCRAEDRSESITGWGTWPGIASCRVDRSCR